jgi:4'-phosphopantetheinyl transferase
VTPFPPRRPVAGLALPPGEIHVWRVPLDPPAWRVEQLGRLLAADEWERANRFRFDQHRRQYVVGRGALRSLLGAYLAVSPERIRFTYGPRGKPFLGDPAAPDFQFNLTNSSEMALVGFVRGPEIGVDLEFMKPMPDLEQIAERFFSVPERDALRELPAEKKPEGFFNCWTRKEAYLKAVGEGLAVPLDSFDVTLAPGAPARMLAIEGDAERATRWFYHHLRPAEDYIGAVAIEGEPEGGGAWQVNTWGFE